MPQFGCAEHQLEVAQSRLIGSTCEYQKGQQQQWNKLIGRKDLSKFSCVQSSQLYYSSKKMHVPYKLKKEINRLSNHLLPRSIVTLLFVLNLVTAPSVVLYLCLSFVCLFVSESYCCSTESLTGGPGGKLWRSHQILSACRQVFPPHFETCVARVGYITQSHTVTVVNVLKIIKQNCLTIKILFVWDHFQFCCISVSYRTTFCQPIW